MRFWPWVSRTAFDAVVSERDRLRSQVDRLLEHRQRIDRLELGAPETPAVPRPRIEPPPRELVDILNAFSDRASRKEIEAQALSRYKVTRDWNRVLEEIKAQLPPKEEA